MSNEHFVYIVRCSDDSLYTGYTIDVNARIQKHNSGKGAKYTRSRIPVELVYREVLSTKSEALRREFEIKQMKRKEKLKLIAEQ